MSIQKNEYDERQLQIRGDVFRRGFFAAIGLFMLNAFLNDYGFVWAEGYKQNLVIIMALTTLVSVEFLVRGAYFSKSISPGTALGVCYVMTILMFLPVGSDFLGGGVFVADGMLTTAGCSLVIIVFLTIITTVGTVQYLRNKKQEKEKD